MIYSSVQKQILQKLLTKYESSKTYKGENNVSQSFSIKPIEVCKDYEKDFTDINLIKDFEKQVKLLESHGLVSVEYMYDRIKKIAAVGAEDGWKEYRKILDVKDKKNRMQDEIIFYSKYLNENKIISNICTEQIERLRMGKESKYEVSEAEKIFNLLKFILANSDEILERELSIAVLHDSKFWEKKYKSKVCKLLKDSNNYSELSKDLDDKEINKVILESHNIFDNPTYVYFKGNAAFQFADGNEILASAENPLAFSSESLKNIKFIHIRDEKVITVENLTSFNRVQKKDCFYIFLSGYHNSAKQNFLNSIYARNKDKKFFHFGDIDPDGFLIFENLKNRTGIPFLKYKMAVSELEKYAEYTKPLEQNDITKAKGLISRGLYVKELNYMLEHNCKLEQEIISWVEK